MDFAKEQVKNNNLWTSEYVDKVFNEFERFMIIKNIDGECSPSDDIDLMWHQIILDTELYLNYCIYKFNKIIHHKPSNAIDQKARKIRLEKTLKLYKEFFNEEPEQDVWNTLECGICFKIIDGKKNFKTNCCTNINYCQKCFDKLKKCPICQNEFIFCPDSYHIFIKQIQTKNILTINVLKTDTISILQSKIKDQTDIPEDQMKLIHNGTQLNNLNSNTLYELGIYPNTQIFVVLKLGGC